MAKVYVYVDGFNLYHALRTFNKPHYKWLDIRKLASHFIAQNDTIEKIYWFSAEPLHIKKTQVLQKHRVYASALKSMGVECIFGYFTQRHTGDCQYGTTRICYKPHEKQTDVNIAVHLVSDALTGRAEKQLLISDDTDMVPAIKMIKQRSNTEIVIISPPFVSDLPSEKDFNTALLKAAGQQEDGRWRPKKIEEIHVQRSLLPAKIKKPSGKGFIYRHKDYEPPKSGCSEQPKQPPNESDVAKSNNSLKSAAS